MLRDKLFYLTLNLYTYRVSVPFFLSDFWTKFFIPPFSLIFQGFSAFLLPLWLCRRPRFLKLFIISYFSLYFFWRMDFIKLFILLKKNKSICLQGSSSNKFILRRTTNKCFYLTFFYFCSIFLHNTNMDIAYSDLVVLKWKTKFQLWIISVTMRD